MGKELETNNDVEMSKTITDIQAEEKNKEEESADATAMKRVSGVSQAEDGEGIKLVGSEKTYKAYSRMILDDSELDDPTKTGVNNPLNKIDKNADKRNPIIRILEKFGELFMLNLIFVLSCLPIVTIGAALVTLFDVTNKMVRNEDESTWKGYWKQFRKDFKIGTQIYVFLIAYAAVIVAEYYYMLSSAGTVNFIVVLIGLELLALSYALPFLFPLAARYDNKLFAHLKNSLILAIANIKQWLFVFWLWMLPIFALMSSAVLFAYTWYLWILILFSMFAYSTSMIVHPIFDKLENPEVESGSDNVKNEEK